MRHLKPLLPSSQFTLSNQLWWNRLNTTKRLKKSQFSL
jgi:hypothetical protein